MMKPRLAVLAAASLMAAACNNGTPAQTVASAVEKATASMAAEASSVANALAPTSTSGTNAYLNLPEGFAEHPDRAAALPENVAESDVLLLQYDAARNITVSAVKSAPYAGEAATLADKLKSALAADKTLAQVQVAAEDKQVRFSYELTGSDPKALESCIAQTGRSEGLLTFCASGTGTTADELHSLLQSSLK